MPKRKTTREERLRKTMLKEQGMRVLNQRSLLDFLKCREYSDWVAVYGDDKPEMLQAMEDWRTNVKLYEENGIDEDYFSLVHKHIVHRMLASYHPSMVYCGTSISVTSLDLDYVYVTYDAHPVSAREFDDGNMPVGTLLVGRNPYTYTIPDFNGGSVFKWINEIYLPVKALVKRSFWAYGDVMYTVNAQRNEKAKTWTVTVNFCVCEQK
jgi:hypothetical protein